jgi:hypothetical protein
MNDEENINCFSNFSKVFSSLSSSPEYTVRAYSMHIAQYCMQATSKQYFKVIFKQIEIHINVK